MSNPHYVRVFPGSPLPDISSFVPFRAVVVIAGEYSIEWQNEVSEWLVASGCLYMMAWGSDCSSWDDSVDYANMFAFPDYEIPDDKFVMTTWHERETLESVFWYAQNCASFSYNDQPLDQTVILDICDHDRREWHMSLFKRSETLAEREPE